MDKLSTSYGDDRPADGGSGQSPVPHRARSKIRLIFAWTGLIVAITGFVAAATGLLDKVAQIIEIPR